MKKWLSLILFAVMLAALPQLSEAEELPSVVDQTRIREHLSAVETYLRTRDTSHLTDAQRIARNENIDRLHDYWVAGVFPHNTLAQHPTPIFVDPDGRACAVAHLMLEAGYQAAVDDVVARQNLAYVNDIVSPGVVAWLRRSGLTAREAAWIQPAYNSCNDDCSCDPDPVCGADGVTYVNACLAERCAEQSVYETGCCETVDEIAWTGSGEFGWVRFCLGDPNEVTEELCPNSTVLVPVEDSQAANCAAARLPDASRWTELALLALTLLLVSRRRRSSRLACD